MEINDQPTLLDEHKISNCEVLSSHVCIIEYYNNTTLNMHKCGY